MSIIAELLCGNDFVGGKMVWLQDDRKPFFFIDIFLFHVHSTVSFFSKLVIPVHVSMEEPVLKTKLEKSTSVNALVDGKGTIANKILQVPTNIKKLSCLYICGLYENPAISITSRLGAQFKISCISGEFHILERRKMNVYELKRVGLQPFSQLY